MRKLDALQKCVICNQVLSVISNEEIMSGERLTIIIDTKNNGEIKSITFKKGE